MPSLIGWWQVLMNQKWDPKTWYARTPRRLGCTNTVHMELPLFYMAEPYISIFCLCPPYRNLTSPYGSKIHNLIFFSKPSFYMVFAYISIFCLCPPYRNMTSPYKPKSTLSWVGTTETFSSWKQCALSKQIFQKFPWYPHFRGFLWRIQNRHAHILAL